MPIESLIGKKLGMTQVFQPDGTVVPVTVVDAGPNWVTQIRTQAKEGYNAVQLGYGAAKRLTKPEQGHLAKAGAHVPRVRALREFRVDDVAGIELGQRVDASVFTPGETVDVIATSKGKGFAGVVKRHHFAGGPKTHGQSDRHRAPGSIGATTTPGRIVKGLRMAGRLGGGQVTVQNIEVVQADPERNIIMLRGAVPGGKGTLVMIRRSIKSRR